MTSLNRVCCVLGGSGFIGQTLVRKLCQTGRIVRVVGRGTSPQNLPKMASYIRINLLDKDSLHETLSDASEVIDLAYDSVPKTSFEDPLSDIQSNLSRTVAIMEALSSSNIERFVYVSSGGTVYGEASSIPLNEKSLTRPISPYGVTKLASECYADIYRLCYKVPAIIARPSNAYGEYLPFNTGQGFITYAIKCCLDSMPITIFGERGTLRDYIHVEDVANALIALLDSGVVGDVVSPVNETRVKENFLLAAGRIWAAASQVPHVGVLRYMT